MTETAKEAARRLSRPMLDKGFKPVALHAYTDASGGPIYWRIRLKHPDTGEKWIRPMKLNGHGYELGEPKFPNGKPLYALHRLVADPDAVVDVVEGEQKADALNKLDMVATTSGGATSAAGTDWEPLRGRTVRIWPDKDDAGQAYAGEVAAILIGLDCRVSCIDVDKLGLGKSEDVIDWLAVHPGATRSDIEALPILTPSPACESPPTAALAQSAPDGDEATIARLAKLSPMNYDRERKAVAEALGIRPGTLDKLVIAARKDADDSGMDFEDVEPWPDPIDAAALLSEIAATVQRFIVCAPETAHAVALWVAMTWLMDVVQIAPLAVITAPEKRCGKSQLLFLLGKLAHRPLTASSISPAAMFRAVDAWRPTLLVDEADAFMRDNEELRGIVNAGHTRDSAYVVRVVGDDLMPQKFSVWGAKALAGIGHLADTLMDRAVVLELRRKLPHENAERLRHAEADLFQALAEKLARFAEDCREAIRIARPNLPASLNDRAQDNWEPLLAIADVAGGTWPELGRRAALKLSGVDSPTMSTGTELLGDILEVFELRKVDRISTADLIGALCADDEKPWATYNRGKPISPRQVSRRLADYGISSSTIRIGGETPKGFLRRMFDEAFSRYLPSTPAASATPPQASIGAVPRVADHPPRCGTETQSATAKPLQHKACGGVADRQGEVTEMIEVEI